MIHYLLCPNKTNQSSMVAGIFKFMRIWTTSLSDDLNHQCFWCSLPCWKACRKWMRHTQWNSDWYWERDAYLETWWIFCSCIVWIASFRSIFSGYQIQDLPEKIQKPWKTIILKWLKKMNEFDIFLFTFLN